MQREDGSCHCHRAGAGRPGCGGGGGDEGGAAHRDAGGGASAGTPGPPGGAPPAPPEWIRIASWNFNRLHWRTGGALWRGAPARSESDYRTLARYVRNLNADVIAFQEVNGPRAAARVFPSRDYTLHLSGRHDPRYDDIHNGFAVRKGRFDRVEKRDYEALGLGSHLRSRHQHRWGVELRIERQGRSLRLLNVHLKSKCFTRSLADPRSRACRTLARQVAPLEAWVDARWREGVPFVVLGDFNRAMDRHGRRDHLWSALDDGDPPGLRLHRLPEGRERTCWRGTSRYHRHPIDFFVFGARAWRRVDPASFREIAWSDADADPRRGLPSDHCPIAVDLFRAPAGAAPAPGRRGRARSRRGAVFAGNAVSTMRRRRAPGGAGRGPARSRAQFFASHRGERRWWSVRYVKRRSRCRPTWWKESCWSAWIAAASSKC